MKNNGETIKILMVGVGGVGKSAITIQFVYNEFVEDYEPTKADSYRKNIIVGGNELVLDILDTAGQEDYASIRDQFLRSGDGYILVFSVTDKDSFETISELRDQILLDKESSSVAMVLVGNKVDLPRVINYEEGESLAKKWGIKYLETSAKNRKNIDEAFTEVGNSILQIKEQTSVNSVNVSKKKKNGSKNKKKGCVIV